MYKLIALDMDGTLLNSDKQISARNKQAIAAAKAKGVQVVLVSGRPVEGMMDYVKQLDMMNEGDFVLSYNASVVQKTVDLEVVQSRILKGSDAKNLASIANDLGVHVHAFTQRHGLITPKHNYYTTHEATVNGLEVNELDFSELEDDEAVMKVMMIDEPDLLSNAIANMPSIATEQYTMVQSAPFFLEFLNPSSNKGAGVGMLATHLGIDASEVIGMGDAGNDKHLIEYAGMGVAMGNATDDIKAIASHITASNDEDGVAIAIEKFVLAN